jgi:hypothetical protein
MFDAALEGTRMLEGGVDYARRDSFGDQRAQRGFARAAREPPRFDVRTAT